MKSALSFWYTIFLCFYFCFCFVYKITNRFFCFLDINSNEKNTLLHLASYYKHPKCVEELLKKGVDVEKTTENDELILYYAEIGGNTECLALLKSFK